jgi:hypothetical protein
MVGLFLCAKGNTGGSCFTLQVKGNGCGIVSIILFPNT